MRCLRLSQVLAASIFVGGLLAIVWNVVRGPVNWTPLDVTVAGASVALGLHVDLLAAVLVTFVASIGLIVSTYSVRNLRGQAGLARFGWALAASYLALTLMITGASLPLMAIGWTASGLLLAVLVAHRGTVSARRSGRLVRRQLLVGDAALWLGVIGLAVVSPTLNRAELGEVAAGNAIFVAAVLLLTVAAMIRSALLPVTGWLPLTAEAPSPVSGYLHAGVVNAAGVLVALWWPLFKAVPAALAVLIVVGAATAVVATVVSKNRPDVKGQLAASTSAQMGYMAVQLGLGLPAAAVLHLIGHGYYKSWTFLRAGGAVTRLRQVPVNSTARGAAAAAIAAVATVAAVLLLVLPQIDHMLHGFGLVALVPVAVASATAGVAIRAVLLRWNLAPARVTGTTLLAFAAALGAYLALLGVWDRVLSGALPEVAVWSTPVAAFWIGLLVLAAAATVWGVRITSRRPDSSLAVAAVSTSLPAPVRRTRGMASGLLPAERPDPAAVEQVLRSAAQLVAPAFPLRSVVASNPLAGLEQLPFLAAARVVERSMGARAFLPEPEYLRMMQQGVIGSQALDAVLADFSDAEGGAGLARVRDEFFANVGQPGVSAAPVRSSTLAQRRAGSRGPWTPAEVAALHDGLWCARVWGSSRVPADGQLYARWQTAAAAGWGRGLGLSALAGQLPSDPREALAELLGRSGMPPAQWFDYLARLLTAAPGWASHAAWREREGYSNALIELAAVRVAHDLAVGGPAVGQPVSAVEQATAGTGLADPLVRRRIWQEALETSYRNGVAAHVQRQVRRGGQAGEPIAQVFMCIDVRSERFRRHLEASGQVQTFGFAGFFGAAVRYVTEYGHAYDQCPVLLQPTYQIAGPADHTRTTLFAGQQARRAAWDTPISAFGLAESTGVFAGISSAVRTFLPGALHNHHAGLEAPAVIEGGQHGDGLPGFGVQELADLAQSALGAVGLTKDFAPLLVIAGHGATVTNNAFAAAYDCGACGGNSGLQNARVLVHALNHPQVREILAERGLVIPEHVQAVAAVHNTTTDEFLLDGPARAQWQLFAEVAERAGVGAAQERLADLPGAPQEPSRRHAVTRADDWAEACPEWGLAGNAAFVIGPRRLTSGLDLAGRVFLHSYEPDSDPQAQVLNTILTAPVVVAQWINSQYYFSTVDAEHFGSGDKSTHNVVGDVGVLAGAHGDIKVGLPWQALFAEEADAVDGIGKHVPMRLSVIAYADPQRILEIVLGNEVLLRLVGNEWISLTAIDPADGAAVKLHPMLRWEPVVGLGDDYRLSVG